MKPKIKKIFTENNDFQHIEVLKRDREKRNKYNEFFIEGAKSINYAIQYNWNIKTYIYSKEKPLSQWALNVLSNSKAELHLELSLKLMEKLSDKEEEYSELLAVVSMKENNLLRIKIR